MHKAELLLESLQKVRPNIALGLNASLSALNRIGNPHERVKIVHIAGTNGKGSVCAMIANILRSAGYNVGTYTSPHLLRWSDSVSILTKRDDLEETRKNAERWHESVLEVSEACGSLTLTAFEAATAAMWLHFARSNVDIAVIEAGVGGRLDATNVCPTAEASVITSVALDHQVMSKLPSFLHRISIKKPSALPNAIRVRRTSWAQRLRASPARKPASSATRRAPPSTVTSPPRRC